MNTPDMIAMTHWASSRETSLEIAEAIFWLAECDDEAARIWETPSRDELAAIWERVTKNGLCDAKDFCWGAAGSRWEETDQ